MDEARYRAVNTVLVLELDIAMRKGLRLNQRLTCGTNSTNANKYIHVYTAYNVS